MEMKLSEVLDKITGLLKMYPADGIVTRLELKSGLSGLSLDLVLKPAELFPSEKASKPLLKKKKVSPSARRRRSQRKRAFLEKKRATKSSEKSNYVQARTITPNETAAIDSDHLETQPATSTLVANSVSTSNEVTKHQNKHESAETPPSADRLAEKPSDCDHYGRRVLSYIWHLENETRLDHITDEMCKQNFDKLWYAGSQKQIPKKLRFALEMRLMDFELCFDEKEIWNFPSKEPPPACPELDCLWCPSDTLLFVL